MKNRVKIANNSNANLFISIHMNKLNQSKYYGWQTFYKSSDEKSIKLAKSIQTSLNKSIQKENVKCRFWYTKRYGRK